MKNIYIIPTDKPSNGYILGKCIKELSDVKIGQFTKVYYLMFSEEYFQPQNIYITNDEEIKEGDWFITKGEVFKCTLVNEFIWRNNFDKFPSMKIDCKKIILTTDQDLIKDGVQKIDDEFLEWFVKNPSCESIEVAKTSKLIDLYADKEEDKWQVKYHIYIPKEEPKQERSYSEEEVKNIVDETIEKFYKHFYTLTKAEMKEQWFEQFKKK